MPNAWLRFQNAPTEWRWLIKIAVLGLTLLLICYPNPALLWRHIQHWRRPEALIEPLHPGLLPWAAELRPQLAEVERGPDALKIVEKSVYDKLPYAFDWETWGVADYIPLVGEALAQGREDCDGRAVVAASLLRNLGYKAELVTDMTHVWVKTDSGETMSPGQLRKFVVTDDGGIHIDWSALLNVPRVWAFGVGVFPLGRELIVVAVLLVLALRPNVKWSLLALAALVLFDGLVILRVGTWRLHGMGPWIGLGHLLAGFVIVALVGRQARRTAMQHHASASADAGSPGDDASR